jgi:hypothetical protein
MPMKNSSDPTRNWTRDLPVCSAVPQPLHHRVPHLCTVVTAVCWLCSALFVHCQDRKMKFMCVTELRSHTHCASRMCITCVHGRAYKHRTLVASLSLWSPRFDSRLMIVRFMVGRVALGIIFVQKLQFFFFSYQCSIVIHLFVYDAI